MGRGADTVAPEMRTEKFPVAVILAPRAIRPALRALNDFARAADDIADDPLLPGAERIARLDAVCAALDGKPALAPAGTAAAIAAARRLRPHLDRHGVPVARAHDLLFGLASEMTLTRVPTWDVLVALCRLSAVPAGRIVLGLHGEDTNDERLVAAADALCIAFQILDHLQDCAADYRRLDRVYVPEDWLAAAGVGADAFGLPHAGLALRDVLDHCLHGVADLLAAADPLPGLVRNRCLAVEAGAALALARALAERLRRHDPVAGRVRVGPWAALPLAAAGALSALVRNRRAGGGVERG